jgi:nicotinate phosphoribosyltransferase
VSIFASGGLDEATIASLVAAGAPIDGFGVGTDMGVSRDAPAIDIAYKLVEYAGKPRMKTSTGKATLPGPKQVYRVEQDAVADHDVLTLRDERAAGRPLLEPVMENGRRLDAGRVPLDGSRVRARTELARLPPSIRALTPADPPYRVDVSAALSSRRTART